MIRERLIATAAALMTLTYAAGCRLLQSGPSDQEVVAAVQKVPPAPPTVGPTYMAEIESVQVQERGPYNVDGKYWPVRVRVKGGAKIKLTNVFQLGVQGDPSKQKAEPLEFVEEARFTKDDFGQWRVSYHYDRQGPRWRRDESELSAGAR
jgi:hypothetical protein